MTGASALKWTFTTTQEQKGGDVKKGKRTETRHTKIELIRNELVSRNNYGI